MRLNRVKWANWPTDVGKVEVSEQEEKYLGKPEKQDTTLKLFFLMGYNLLTHLLSWW